MTRIRALTTFLALLTVAGLAAGCSRGGAVEDEYTTLTTEGQALQAMGFEAADLAAVEAVGVAEPRVDTTATADPKGDRNRPHRWKRLRFGFGRHALHGEAVVQTADGLKTVVAQRGTITEITATSVTVKSADGFTLTWTFGDPIHVVEHRKTVQPDALATGDTIGIAGIKVGTTPTARLIVVPGK